MSNWIKSLDNRVFEGRHHSDSLPCRSPPQCDAFEPLFNSPSSDWLSVAVRPSFRTTVASQRKTGFLYATLQYFIAFAHSRCTYSLPIPSAS